MNCSYLSICVGGQKAPLWQGQNATVSLSGTDINQPHDTELFTSVQPYNGGHLTLK